MEVGERSCSESDDGSSASWVILNDDEHVSEADEPLAAAGEGAAATPAAESDPATPQTGEAMDSSGDSAKTVIDRHDGSAGVAASEAAPSEAGKVEEGSDIEVIAADQTDDMYFEDDPMELSIEVESSTGSVRLVGSLSSETVLRQRRARRAPDAAEPPGQDRDRDKGSGQQFEDAGREEKGIHHQENEEQQTVKTRPAVQVVPPTDSDKDRWAEDTDLSSLTDQMVLEEPVPGRLRQYVHQRNNTVNHLLTVLLVLCVTCVLGLGVGHFLGWLHHHEMTEEMVHTLDEKLDVLRDDLMTCMTTEDDQDLDNKWIKELLTENEALMQQLHSEESPEADSVARCSQADYTELRDEVNQLRMENDELKANIAKMRYGISAQDGYVLRRHRDQINQLVTENSELARELRRTRYLQPPAGLTHKEEAPAPSAGQQSSGSESGYSDDSADSGDSPADSADDSTQFLAPTPISAFSADSTASTDSIDSTHSSDDSDAPLTSFSDSDSADPADSSSDSADSAADSDSQDGGLLSALLSWRPAPGSAPLQEARRRLWSLWQEASDFSRAEPASKYVKMAGRSLAKVEKTLMKAMQKMQQFGQEMLEDDGVGGGRVEKVAGKIGRKVDKVVAKLDARWQEIRSKWEGKVAAREAEDQENVPTPVDEPTGLPPNDTDPSVAAFYARRSRHRQRERREDGENWQMGRGRSRADLRGAFHGGSWLLERAQARQQLRQRRGEEAEVPPVDQRWRQERAGRRGEEAPRSNGRWRHEWEDASRHEWRAVDDDDDMDDDNDDVDDDYDDHSARWARHMAANARFRERIQKTVQRHTAKIDKKVRENHWKHFGGRNRHEFRQRVHKY